MDKDKQDVAGSLDRSADVMLERLVVKTIPESTWRILECMAGVGEIGGAALRGAVRMGGNNSSFYHFGKAMCYLRDVGAVAFRRPTFAGELGESTKTATPWIYRLSEFGYLLLVIRQRHVLEK